MDIYYKREVSVGFLVIAAAAVFFVSLAWLKGHDFGRGSTAPITVQLADVTGLKEGDPVFISGVNVGRVTSVNLEAPGRVIVNLAVVTSARPHADATVQVSMLDFFGAQKIDYMPGTSSSMLEPGQVIIGTKEASVMSNAAGLADQAAEVLTGLQRVLSEENVNSLQATMQSARDALDMIARLDRGPLMQSATATMESLQGIAARLDEVAESESIDASLENLEETTANLGALTAGLAELSDAVNSIVAKVDSGEGSLGQLVNDDMVVQDVHAVMSSLQMLLDDLRERPQRYIHVKASIF